jgi:hypothetical protein
MDKALAAQYEYVCRSKGTGVGVGGRRGWGKHGGPGEIQEHGGTNAAQRGPGQALWSQPGSDRELLPRIATTTTVAAVFTAATARRGVSLGINDPL